MKGKFLFTLLVALAAEFGAMAQSGWNWPEDPAMREKAQEKNAYYTDMLKADNYSEAIKPLNWLLQNTPDLNTSIYINGVKVYKGLADEVKDTQRKNQLEDSVVTLYDLRMKYFDNKVDVSNRQAYDAYTLWKDRAGKYKELYGLQKNNFYLSGKDIMTVNLIAYLDAMRLYKAKGGDITDDMVLDAYDTISSILEYKIAQSGSSDRLDRIKDLVDKVFSATVQVNCDFVENNLGAKLKADPTNMKLAERIVKFSFAGKCTDTKAFLRAATLVETREKDFGLARLLGLRYKSLQKYDSAEKYLKQAISYSDDNLKKADVYLDLADVASKLGRKSTARSYANNALEQDPSRKEAYDFIGNLYFGSYNDCKGGDNVVKDRAVFIAAYEMYKKAGDAKGMAAAKEQFPSQEEIFTYNMEVGQQVTVGCWINETVTIQKRD